MREPRSFEAPWEITRESQLHTMLGLFVTATDAHAAALKSGNPERIARAGLVLDGARDAARILLMQEGG
jgi:hypothetical protein